MRKIHSNLLYNFSMQIPTHLHPFFQEYEPEKMAAAEYANLIIQRTLEFGTWDDIHWLFELYGARRIRLFLRAYGQRLLQPVTFNYWRRLLGLRTWKVSPLPTAKGELWNR